MQDQGWWWGASARSALVVEGKCRMSIGGVG